MRRVALVIPDSGPLISLALAKALDLLLAIDIPVYVVDQVFRECTRDPAKPGAAAIRELILANPDAVRVVETFVGKAAAAEASDTGPKRRGLGEAAIAEFLANIDQVVEPGVPVLLLFEDADVRRINVVVNGDVHLLSTWSFLVGLAEVGVIDSAERLWQAIEAAGRTPALMDADKPSPDIYGDSYWKPGVL